jgi:hypothetical protein
MTLPAQTAHISVQVVSPEVKTAIRIFLDRKLIFDGKPQASTAPEQPTGIVTVGSFDLKSGERHMLIAEAPSTHTKAELEWTPEAGHGGWIVIRYYPGRYDAREPAFFTFVMQATAAASK